MTKLLLAAATSCLLLGSLALPSGANGAPTVPQATVVSANPADYTPFVRNGKVLAIAQVGSRIIVGGKFTDIKGWQAGSAAYQPTNIFAFNAATGAIDAGFLPTFNGEVRTVIAAADGRSIYVGGTFTKVNGASASNLVKLDATDGHVVTAFNASLNGWVNDMALKGTTLYVGGHFDRARKISAPRLAALDATTGKARSDFTIAVNGAIRTSPWVSKLDVSTDGSRLVIIGNFLSVGGQARSQLAVIDLTTSPATVSGWDTDRYPSAACASVFETYLRDVDIAPDGSYFVVVGTGAHRGTNVLCDAAARWELSPATADQQPTWASYTGGDTLYSVRITGSAIYIGGHERWANNTNTGGDTAGAGSVSRAGLGALDPVNGMPFSWNPGRDRGVGVFAILATADGIYVGSDTNAVGGEWHPRIAKFPLAGGTTPPAARPTALPTSLYTAGADGTVSSRTYDGATFGPADPLSNDAAWTHVRGSFMANGTLYTGSDDGHLYARRFDGTVFAAPVDLNSWANFSSVRGMAFDNGRIYFTVAGDQNLHMRYFELDGALVGSQDFVVSGPSPDGLTWNTTLGLTAIGGQLYGARTDGTLGRTTLASNGVVAATQITVSGPAIDGVDWTSVGIFAFNG